MGVDGKKHSIVPPLPAPTESESTVEKLATDLSKPTETRSSYSLPEDGTPVTIKTRGHKHNKSQTSLLIEYFEGGKSSGAAGSSDQRKPSVRVRLTPSKNSRKSGSDRDHIQITETKTRKASLSRRRTTSPLGAARLDREAVSTLSGDLEDAKSMSSYASATEESNVSRNPIDIEIDRSGNVRRRRPASPLIPAADSNAAGYQNPAAMSDISAIPTDSFLDGSGPTSSSYRMSESKTRSKSPPRARDVIGGAAAGVAAGMAVDKLRNKKRDTRDDDILVSKSRDKERSERRKSSKSRSSSVSEKDKHSERTKTPRKRSSGGHAQDSLVSAADTSALSSNLSPSHRSYDQHSMRSGTSKASSINNPKLLETVEDAIRRLILPELDLLKREQSKKKSRRDSTTSSATTASRDEYPSDRRRSSATEKHVETPRDSIKKERRDREARHDFDYSPSQSGVSHVSVDETSRDFEQTPKRSSDRLPAAALGAAAGALATAAVMHETANSDDKRTRRRRRAELRSRTSESLPHEEYDESELSVPDPPMPLMASEVGTTMSGMTRTSILSADTDRPHSASEELTPVQEVSRGVLSESSTPTPTRTSRILQNGLGTQHANISHGDLRALPRRGTGTFEGEEYESSSFERNAPPPVHQEYEEEEYEEGHDAPGFMQSGNYDYYNTQDVPPPLNYVPYQPERRGLSPIPSVSGYTEGGSEAPNRDSRVTHTSGSVSSPDKAGHDRALDSPTSAPSNVMSRGFEEDDRSVRSSGMDYGHVGYNDSEVSHAESGQAVRAVGANPRIVRPHIAIESLESNVASLVDGSMLDGSVLTNESGGYGQNAGYSPRHSMGALEEERSLGHASLSKRSVESHHSHQSQRDLVEERNDTSVSGSQRSREFAEEYDVDDYGRKVPTSKYRQSPTASEAAITLPALTAAAAAIKAAQSRGKGPAVDEVADEYEGAGVQRNKSFKERAMNGDGPLNLATRHVVDQYDEPKMDFRAIPNYDDHMPEIGHWDDGESIDDTEHQVVGQAWSGNATPRQMTPVARDLHDQEQHEHVDTHSVHEKGSGHGIGLPEVAAAAAIGTVAGMAATGNHSRQPSQEQDEEWHRTSDDRKRDTLVTNPYEGASPIVNIPGLHDIMPEQQGYDNPAYGDQYSMRSPLGHNPDEGYISQGPNKTPDIQGANGKGIDFESQQAQVDDPFYVTKHARHISGMSHGMDTPFYDAATGAGIDRIESKDIMALMQHLMVRDAQRSARDTEILVTLVRAAAEMRNSFDDIKRMLADTEDVIITEVKENTDKTVQRAINGPRPFPGSGARSLQSGTMTVDDLPTKKRNIFRRALKGLSGKGVNDLGRIEDMLNQLLTEVDVLKAQTVPGNTSASNQGERSFDNLQPEGAYEQDRGYEPEGNAGTSTASHASQSGHLSIPQSRGASAKLGYDRKFSDHRISTVPEDNEDDYDYQPADDHVHNSNPDMLMTPAVDVQRGGSVPLATPPRTAVPAQASMSNENTPRTDKGKKHKSTSSTGWFGIPKISRWSETTTSSVAQAFRRSKKNDEDGNFQSPPSRSGSDLAQYDDEYGRTDPYGEDKLHSGFSEQDLAHEDDAQSGQRSPGLEDLQAPPTIPAVAHYRMTPEDPKYKAHRDSLNLQHPQPRPGQTELFKATLESQAHEFDSPMSPRSAEWAGSATSLHRLPRNANRDSYGSAADQAGQQQQYWTSSPAAGNNMTATSGPPRPPKEPLDLSGSPGRLTRGTPPKSNRISKLAKTSPLPYHSVESGYGTMTHGAPTASYISHGHTHSRDSQQSPKLENRNLSGALGVPTRRPSGPRAMTPKSPARSAQSVQSGNTFGTIASQDTDTF
ncbi:hypothetical protein CONLIGDRAFT_657775 [Coniochaeta ligniaria NRRL 30616]|uniref:Uncharacterized protein n=1 Tax=Coniochaeta ligniaria NRRL 30616 TaxID=1408157 RepID=A0A1J7J164_9PEZI|nr:hypothetical protein CONLIGDRAFT_657775 [Coniochaeta ligniaria NRRL 30616]